VTAPNTGSDIGDSGVAEGAGSSSVPTAAANARLPRFSVILATRDRPALFAEALDSVLAQRGAEFEVHVVNDGSRADLVAEYEPIWSRAAKQLGERFAVHTLVHRPRGHGQSYSLNFGVAAARGDYVCFLDDDDKWTDPGHLARAAGAIDAVASGPQPLDLYMANQTAWISPERPVGTLWLGTLEAELQQLGRQPDASGVYAVSVDELMASTGFCHLNCLTVRRALFEQVGGMDEGIRWECDRDLFLRLVDVAACMRFHPAVVSYHRVPDPAKAANMTTTLGMADKRLLQSLGLDRALLRSRQPAIRRHARQHKVYALERLALEFADRGDPELAAFFAGQAFGARPSPGRAALWLRSQWQRWTA
jgi:glycosyltransferase involved in cell wall biosynthesis